MPKYGDRAEYRTNREGLTFWEWFKAANHWNPSAVDEKTARAAWRAGEDPTEYAARAIQTPVPLPKGQPVILLLMR